MRRSFLLWSRQRIEKRRMGNMLDRFLGESEGVEMYWNVTAELGCVASIKECMSHLKIRVS